jgi:hypothetical protein
MSNRRPDQIDKSKLPGQPKPGGDDAATNRAPVADEAPATPAAEAADSPPAGTKGREAKPDKAATKRNASRKGTEAAVSKLASVLEQVKETSPEKKLQYPDSAVASALNGLVLQNMNDRAGNRNATLRADVYDGTNVLDKVRALYNDDTGLMPEPVRIAGLKGPEAAPYVVTQGSARDLQGVLKQTLGSVNSSYGAGTVKDEAALLALMKAQIPDEEVAYFRQQVVNRQNPDMADLPDDVLREALLEQKLAANNKVHQQVHGIASDRGRQFVEAMPHLAAMGDETVNAGFDHLMRQPGAMARLAGGGGLNLEAAGNWMQAKPTVYGGPLEKLNELPNWVHAGGGAATAAGIAALLAQMGQPQQDDDAYLQMLAANNAGVSSY